MNSDNIQIYLRGDPQRSEVAWILLNLGERKE